ncbi:MAG: SHOCT domain-containing protein [Candidatus Dormibacteraceae bacterium]
MILFPFFLLFILMAIAISVGCRGAWRRQAWGGALSAGGRSPAAGPRPDEAPGESLERARAILHQRYARGEISTEDYRERVDQLF